MPTGIEAIERDRKLQNHWLLRFAAALIDWVLVATPFWAFYVLSTIGGVPSVFNPFFSIGAGVIWVFYSAFFEYQWGETIGKKILGLRVVSTMGEIDFRKTTIRNLSKIHSLLLLIDAVLGLATMGDPRQRYLDRISNTIVVETGNLKVIEKP